MALSAPPPYSAFDRTLPKPSAMLPNATEARRSSSLLQHHISSGQFLAPVSDESGRRSTVSCLPRLALERETVHTEYELVNHRQASIMSAESPTESSSEGTSPPETSSGYCLCVPDPKIPRPRNGKFCGSSTLSLLLTWSKLLFSTARASMPRL